MIMPWETLIRLHFPSPHVFICCSPNAQKTYRTYGGDALCVADESFSLRLRSPFKRPLEDPFLSTFTKPWTTGTKDGGEHLWIVRLWWAILCLRSGKITARRVACACASYCFCLSKKKTLFPRGVYFWLTSERSKQQTKFSYKNFVWRNPPSQGTCLPLWL